MYKTNQAFWACYHRLPRDIQQRADKNFALLKQDPEHPSLNFKRVGRTRWSVRISRNYRALAREENGTLVWFWIGKHDEYIRRI
ncbi:MAG: hypothetical protein OXD49_20015 [Candidatus Poribacteria bacterium]|nr:hypothetical protein [Candidatus Poribacteria bacterium]